jgi:hypothetical protein
MIGRHIPILSPCCGFFPDNKPGEKSIAGYRRDDLIAPASQECIGIDSFTAFATSGSAGEGRPKKVTHNKKIEAEIAPI